MKKSGGRPSRTFPSRTDSPADKAEQKREPAERPAAIIPPAYEKRSRKIIAYLGAAAVLAIVLVLLLVRPCRDGKKAGFGQSVRDGARTAAREYRGEKKDRARKTLNRSGEAGAELPDTDESAKARAAEKRTPNLGTEIEIIEPK